MELFRAVKRSEHFVLAESETSTWGSSYPLLAEIKTARTGFLLQPDGVEGDTILRTAIPRVNRAEFPAGRGYYVARGAPSGSSCRWPAGDGECFPCRSVRASSTVDAWRFSRWMS